MNIVAILYNIRSLHNVGSIFRTADAAGVEKIYLCGITPAPVDRFGKFRPQLTKVALGAERYVQWEKISRTNKLIARLKEEGYKIFAVEQSKNAIPYFEISNYPIRRSANGIVNKSRKKYASKVALIFGNEVRGLPKTILRKADKILEIPMKGKKESLNVAVAFSIVVFHLIHLCR